MKFIYPAVFRKTENGTYHGFFPDLECCVADGPDLEDAVENAREAARDWTTQMKQLITGSLWSFLRMTVIFHLFLIKRIWSFRREILYGIFL